MSMVAVRPPKEFLSQMYHPVENNERAEERRLLKKLAQIIVENGQYEENASENDMEHELEEETIYLDDDDYPEDQGDQVQEQQQMQEPYYQQTEKPYTDYQVNNIIKIMFAKLDM